MNPSPQGINSGKTTEYSNEAQPDFSLTWWEQMVGVGENTSSRVAELYEVLRLRIQPAGE